MTQNLEIDAQQQIHLRILQCAHTHVGTMWNLADNYSSYWRLYINADAGASVLSRDQSYIMHRNEVWFIPAWVNFHCVNNRRVGHFYIHFDLMGLSGAAVREIFHCPMALTTPGNYDHALEMLHQAQSQQNGQINLMCRFKSLLYDHLAELISQLSQPQVQLLSRSLSAHRRYAELLRYIDEHLTEPLDNARLAKICHQSESHFVRSFHNEMQQTPAKYVQERRIAAAAEKLVFSAATIERIAEETGFANRFHFSRVFTKTMSVGPGTYRKTQRF